MQTAELVEGRYYAFREARGAGQPLLKVKLLEPLVHGMTMTIEHIHPNTRNILVEDILRLAVAASRGLPSA